MTLPTHLTTSQQVSSPRRAAGESSTPMDSVDPSARLGQGTAQTLTEAGAASDLSQMKRLEHLPQPRLPELFSQNDLAGYEIPTHKLVTEADENFVKLFERIHGEKNEQAERPEVLKPLTGLATKNMKAQQIKKLMKYLVEQHAQHDLKDYCGPEGYLTKNLLEHLDSDSKGLVELINLIKEKN